MPTSLAQYRSLLSQELPALATKYRIATLGIFGSRARGDSHEGSDLDLLVSFDQAPSLFQFIELEHELTDLLGTKVDLVMRDSLKPHVEQRVLRELVPV